MSDHWIVFGVLLAALALFVRGPWRYDLVALLALLALCLAGIVPAAEAFLGFGHPAVITVAAVLVISGAMRNAGVVDLMGSWLERVGDSRAVQVIVVTLLVAFCSAFMNNVGAVAILIPAVVQLARRAGRSPAYLLMPLAFGSLLGGLITLIGTPPNIIISAFRTENVGRPFGMFDFAWVGGATALVGVLFIGLIGWRLIPQRTGESSVEDLFEIDKYTSELRIPKESKAIGKTVREVGAAVEAEFVIIGLAHGKQRISMPSYYERLREDDVILVEGDAEAIKTLAETLQLEMVGDKELRDELLKSDSVEVIEAIVAPESYIERRTAGQMQLRRRFGVNLLGVARQGRRLRQRLRDVRFRAGDILLLQGDTQAIQQAITVLGCLPLAARGLRIGKPRRVLMAAGLFAAALVATTIGWLPAQIAFIAAAMAMVMTRLMTLREAYQSVDWSVIVLLGAMIPVGAAMESSGGAQIIADGLRAVAGDLPPLIGIAALLIVTAFLSDVMNNAASAVLMAPIALRLAEGMGYSPDPFLMAVAIGASSSFLTPIGHQSNTLVMGPGGYRFGDYFRVGLPVSLITWCTAVPMILLCWPMESS